MLSRYLYLLFLIRLIEIFKKHRVTGIVFHDAQMFAVYYDEMSDKLQYVSLSHTLVQDIDGTTVYRPVLDREDDVDRHWLFLELSEESKPMSHYDAKILDLLVRKVRRSMGTP